VVNATPNEFDAQLSRDRPVNADLWGVSYEIDKPYQQVTHDVGMLKTEQGGDWGSFQAIYAFQINLRKEYEQVRADITGPQFDFTLRTHSLDAFYEHPVLTTEIGDFEGGLGFQGTFQENVYRGLPLIPNFRGFSGGVYGYERLSLQRFDFEVGARLDGLRRAAFLGEHDYEKHVRRETLDESSCEALEFTYRCPADYAAGSVSFGGLAHVVPEHFDIKVDLSTAVRFPNVDELYVIGHSPSLPVYATGYPSLGTETVWNGSLTSGLRSDFVEFEASVYAQVIEDYIYFSPVLNSLGNPKVEVTIRGAYPAWDFQPIDARFAGVDGSLLLGPESALGFRAVGGLTRGEDLADGGQLVGTPADYLLLSLIGRAPALGAVHELEVELNLDLVGTQSRVNPELDFAPAPSGYTLLGAGVQAVVGRRNPVRVGLDAHNLLNTTYREYSSLLRYYANRPGRDIRLRVGMDF
jgi:iron complex outermembrane receptor protein